MTDHEPNVEPLFTRHTARELCSIPDPDGSDLLLGPLIVRGHRTIVVADTGHGKTTLAAQLAAAVLTGAEALGYQGAGVGPVMIVDLEQGIRSIKRVLREANLAERDDVIYLSVPDGLALDSDDWERFELEQIVTEHRPTVLVLDPYYKAHRGDANEERAVVDLMRFLDRLRADYGFALVLPAHPRKDATSNGARKLTLHDVSGSGAVTRGAELVVALERLSHGYGRLRILKDRDFDLQVGEAWPLLFERGEGFRRDPKDERDAADLEQQIAEDRSAEWRTRKEWAGQLGIREKRAGELLDKLAARGHVEFRVGPPRRSPKARCYRTAPVGWAQSGGVTPSIPDDRTAPTTPTSIGDVGSGRSSWTAPTPGSMSDSKRPPLTDESAENEGRFIAECQQLVDAGLASWIVSPCRFPEEAT